MISVDFALRSQVTNRKSQILQLLRIRWREGASLRSILSELWYFLRDSTPERHRARFGDLDFDFDHHVDTTASNLSARTRLVGAAAGAGYQPTDPAQFRELLDQLHIDFPRFTFLDLGSGKGRALLLASDYPFRRILGIELLPELHSQALQNIARYKSDSQRCFALSSVCQDARQLQFPAEPLVLYLFNPLPEEALRSVVTRLEQSLSASPRNAYVLYANPILEHIFSASPAWTRLSGARQYAIYRWAAE